MDKSTWFNKKKFTYFALLCDFNIFHKHLPNPLFSPSAHSIILPNVSKIWDHLRANVKFCWYGILWFVAVQSLSHVWLFATPWTAACQASLSFTVSPSLLKLRSIESVMPSNHLILCHPLLLPSVSPSIRDFMIVLVNTFLFLTQSTFTFLD